MLCGHLLGKGWPFGSRLWCLLWVCHFPIGILGQVWYLIVSIPDLCTLTYLENNLSKPNTIYKSRSDPRDQIIGLCSSNIWWSGLLKVRPWQNTESWINGLYLSPIHTNPVATGTVASSLFDLCSNCVSLF